jgi:hypothetical protein
MRSPSCDTDDDPTAKEEDDDDDDDDDDEAPDEKEDADCCGEVGKRGGEVVLVEPLSVLRIRASSAMSLFRRSVASTSCAPVFGSMGMVPRT